MSALHEELAAPVPCKVCAYLSGLAPSEQAVWRAELALPVGEVGNSAVARALTRRGVDVTETSVRRHRAKHA